MADLFKSLTKIKEYKIGLMTLRKTSSKFVNKLYNLGFTGPSFPEAMLSFFLSNGTESINSDHHLRCGGWLNFEFSKREKHSGWVIKTIYKKLKRGMLKHIPLL